MKSIPKYIIWIASAIVIGFLVWYFSNIVMYIIAAALLTILGLPLLDKIERIHIKSHKIPRWLAALVTELVLFTILLGLFFSLIPLVFFKFNELSTLDITTLAHSIDAPLANLQTFMITRLGMSPEFSVTESLLKSLRDVLNLQSINSIIGSTVSTVGNTGIALFAIAFITFFFLKEDNLFRRMVLTLSPERYAANINHALDSIEHLLRRYFTGILCESTILLVLVSTVLSLFGMRITDAIFIGLLVGVLNVIPYIGPLIGLCLGIIMGILSPIGTASVLSMVLIVGGTIATAQILDNVVLQPVLYSNSVHAHPLEIFIVILIAGSVGGMLGMLLAIPAYNVVRVFAKEFFNNIRLVQTLTKKI